MIKAGFKLFLTFLVGLIANSAYSQEIKITDVRFRGGDIEISYELRDNDLNRRYSIHLYTSRDNYLQPMTQVEGNIGVGQTIGSDKVVIWHANEELGQDFTDDIALELKGNVYVPFINITDFGESEIIKRTSDFDLTWSGGRGDNVLTIELFQGDKRVHIFGEEPGTTGIATLSIPRKIKPGKDYRIKISDKRNRDEIVYTPEFEVKRKIPLVYQLGSGAVVAILGAILVDSLIPEPDIPEPPLPNG